jgi:Ni/Co efflux regulator RcnB
MKRIISVLAAMAIMAAMVAASAMPAFAQGRSDTAPNCKKGNDTAFGSPGSDNRSGQATKSINKNFYGNDLYGTYKNPNAAFCFPK